MSFECGECEWDARAGHDPDCSRSTETKLKKLQEKYDKLWLAFMQIRDCMTEPAVREIVVGVLTQATADRRPSDEAIKKVLDYRFDEKP